MYICVPNMKWEVSTDADADNANANDDDAQGTMHNCIRLFDKPNEPKSHRGCVTADCFSKPDPTCAE